MYTGISRRDDMKRDKEDVGTILVVEDYDDVRSMLKLLLESEHFRVLEAANGPEALKAVKAGHPDIIVTDLGLPGFDGFETIRRIRKTDGFQNTPIIVLTAHNDQAAHENAFRAGSNYFIAKPVDFDELESLLQHILVNGTGTTPRDTRLPAQRAGINKRPRLRRGLREIRWAL